MAEPDSPNPQPSNQTSDSPQEPQEPSAATTAQRDQELREQAPLSPDAASRFYQPASFGPASLCHIDWPSAFPFVHLFRGFRLATHPSKLLLALAAVLLLYAGGRVLDGLWLDRYQALPGEAQQFDQWLNERNGRPSRFGEVRQTLRDQAMIRYEDARAAVAREQGVEPETIELADLKQALLARRAEGLRQIEDQYRQSVEGIGGDERLSAEQRQRQLAAADTRRADRVRALHEEIADQWQELSHIDGRGLFMEFYEYETGQFNAAVQSVLTADIAGLFAGLWGFLYVGPLWGFSQHPLYFTLFSIWLLVLMAIFGGAIARVAAVQIARDEKISLRSSLRFSSGKVVSFLSAPLIPILIILVVALAVALAGALGNIPWAGEIIIGAGFFLALLGGFIITLVLIGLIGGFSLMYPTVAAEGTDSFDAISRSFSYLYAKPWRLGFYALVALLYGAVTYLFVRLFLWMVLIASHTAAGLLIFRHAAGQDLLSAMWPPPPGYGRLSYDIDFINLSLTEDIGAALIAFWVYLLVALLAAYALSLYFSLSTVIYFLMRKEVDATDLEDVYLDPHDEEFAGYADVPEAPTEAPMEPAAPKE